jgi:hypothetical protein
MSTITLSYPNVIPAKRTSAIRLILILASLALLAGTILSIVISTTQDTHPANSVSALQNSVVPVPVPTPPPAVIQPIPSETPAPPASGIGITVVAVPVPTP